MRHPRAGSRSAPLILTLEEEVFLELQRTAQASMRWVVEALKPEGLTPSQFNVLRILRGARPDGLSHCRIGERMVTYDPDLTRLLDRLEARELVTKARDTADRRVVNVHITEAGVTLVEGATRKVAAALKQALSPLAPRDQRQLATALEQARAGLGSASIHSKPTAAKPGGAPTARRGTATSRRTP